MWEDIDIYGKWLSTIIIFNKIKQSGMKVSDLGSGDSPIPHIISDQGYDVDAIDRVIINILKSINKEQNYQYIEYYKDPNADW